MGRVSGKVIIITGAASGLGKADAFRLHEEGAKLVLTDINQTEGQKVADECDALFIRQDVGEEDSWPALVEATVAHYRTAGCTGEQRRDRTHRDHRIRNNRSLA